MEEATYRVRVLGGFAVERLAGETAPPLPQRRADAVLAVLAVCGPIGCTRDRLVAFLWPESDNAHARHNLRDALYAIRRTLGADAVSGSADTLRLDPSVVTSDVQEFTEALESGHLADAVTIYRGPLLDGFHLSGATEFDQWLDGERDRCFRERQQALKRLAKRAEEEGRWDGAADWWGRAVAGDPLNSRLVVRRMVALTRAGDRANAIQEAQAHCLRLASELELEPDEAFLEELERVRSGELGAAGFFTPPPPARGSAGDGRNESEP